MWLCRVRYCRGYTFLDIALIYVSWYQLLQHTLASIEIWPICKAGYNEVLKLMTAWPVATLMQASRLPVKVLLSAHMYALGTS